MDYDHINRRDWRASKEALQTQSPGRDPVGQGLRDKWGASEAARRVSWQLGGPQGELGGPPGLPEEMVLFFCCVLCYFTFVGMSQR